jgi:hypothetical protein
VNGDATARAGVEGLVMVIARHAGGVPDEGFRIFTRELAERLRARGPAVVYTAGGEPAPGMVLVSNPRPLVSIELQRAIRRHRPRAIHSEEWPGIAVTTAHHSGFLPTITRQIGSLWAPQARATAYHVTQRRRTVPAALPGTLLHEAPVGRATG